MSASPIAKQPTENQDIPSKRIVINDSSQLPANYSSTPGGTLFSTTPGGTRIVYEREFLMNLRNSPLSQTPPRNMPSIPTELLKTSNHVNPARPGINKDISIIEETAEQFEMDM